MPNPVDTNRIKVVHVFDPVFQCSQEPCAEIQSVYVLATLETTYAAHCNCFWFIT